MHVFDSMRFTSVLGQEKANTIVDLPNDQWQLIKKFCSFINDVILYVSSYTATNLGKSLFLNKILKSIAEHHRSGLRILIDSAVCELFRFNSQKYYISGEVMLDVNVYPLLSDLESTSGSIVHYQACTWVS